MSRCPTPLVSVVIPTYCRPRYLERSVRSVVDQTYDNIELIVVDDNPQTPASEVLADVPVDELAGSRYIRGGDHDCANAARNTGVAAASGDFIAFLDDDDYWLAEKVSRQVSAFGRSADDVGLVYTGVRSVRESGRERTYVPDEIDGDLTQALLCRNVVGSMSVVMVAAAVAEETPLDDRFSNWGDIVWYIDLSTDCDFELVPEPLAVYEHTSPDRLSDDLDKTVSSYHLFIDKYRPLAADYGRVFDRKFRAWAAFRTGQTAFQAGRYGIARKYFAIAVWLYPVEGEFSRYLLSALGGNRTHEVARRLKSLLP